MTVARLFRYSTLATRLASSRGRRQRAVGIPDDQHLQALAWLGVRGLPAQERQLHLPADAVGEREESPSTFSSSHGRPTVSLLSASTTCFPGASISCWATCSPPLTNPFCSRMPMLSNHRAVASPGPAVAGSAACSLSTDSRSPRMESASRAGKSISETGLKLPAPVLVTLSLLPLW